MIGDDDGLVFVPSGLAASVLDPCLARVQAETEWEAILADGRSTVDTFGVPAAVRLS